MVIGSNTPWLHYFRRPAGGYVLGEPSSVVVVPARMDPLLITGRLLLAGLLFGTVVGALSAVLVVYVTDTGSEWVGSVVFVSLFVGLVAGLAFAAVNAVVTSVLLHRSGSLSLRAVRAAACGTGAAATILIAGALLPLAARHSTLVVIGSLILGAVAEVLTDVGYRWALST